MANADQNNLKTDHLEDNRNERNTAARQPGASGAPPRELTPEEARREAEQHLGKTAKHTSSDQHGSQTKAPDR
jgi:hypothetical protein